MEIRRESGVADPHQEADDHQSYRQVTSSYHRPRSDHVQSGEGSCRQYSDGNRSQVNGPPTNWTRWNRNYGAVRALETVSTERPTNVPMVGQTSVSMVSSSTTNVPMVGQTMPAQDEAVVSMLHQIFDLANIEKIRERVYHPSNRVEPFNQALLMESCSQGHSQQDGSTGSVRIGTISFPWGFGTGIQTIASATGCVCYNSSSTGSSHMPHHLSLVDKQHREKIYGVAQEEAEFCQAGRDYATSQRKPQSLLSRPTQAKKWLLYDTTRQMDHCALQKVQKDSKFNA